MAEHGGDLHGYVRHYGSGFDDPHHGDGGELIYEADYQELERLRNALKRETSACVSPNTCLRVGECRGLTPCRARA